MLYPKTWNKVLGAGETVEHEFSLSPRFIYVNIFFWFFVGLATVWIYGAGFILFALALFYFGFYLRWANHFAITNKRVIIHRGWLSTHMTSADFPQITDIAVEQSLTERLLYGSGKILINTAGSAAYEIILTNIGNPYEVKRQLSLAMERNENDYRISKTTTPSSSTGTVGSSVTPV